MKQCDLAVDFEPPEADRHALLAFESPEENVRLVDIVGGESGLLECRLEPVALEPREREAVQARRRHYRISLTRSGGRQSRVPFWLGTTGRSIRIGCSVMAAMRAASLSFGLARPSSSYGVPRWRRRSRGLIP